MIIRDHDQTIIMIEQNHHAHISAEIISNWQDILFKEDPYFESVLYAIKQHDYGWHAFDSQPFLNDKTNLPYSFIDFPVIPKTVLYTQGVDIVEQVDSYAAALCSAHYMRFLENNPTHEAKEYLKHEKKRTEKILTNLTIDKVTFSKHLAMLQFADNISLYVCLNEPGVSKSDVHYFFKEGIPISLKSEQIKTNKIQADWLDNKTISLKGLPYVPDFSILISYKELNKQAIKRDGLIKSYQATPYNQININFKIS